MDLRHGEFFGREVVAAQLGGFALSLTRYDERMSVPWHAHRETYVTFVLRGAYRERLRNATRDCAVRTALVHPAGEQHADEFSRPGLCLNVVPEAAWLRSIGVRGVAVEVPVMLTTPAASTIGSRLRRELQRRDALSPIVVEGLMLELFAETTRHRDVSRPPSWLRAVRDTIATEFASRLTIASLAASAGVHPTHLARAFRQHYGCTVGELQRELRVAYALLRIEAGDALNTIAADAGFADQSHLTRTFRKVTGSTPAEIRRRAR